MAIKEYDRLFIGGDWVAPEGTGTIDVISPSTEEIMGRVPDATEADVDKAVAAAREAFDRGPWPRMTPAERAEVLTKVANAMTADLQGLSELLSTEMGAPIGFAQMALVLAPTMIFNYYAGLAETYPFEEVRQGLLNPEVLVRQEPVGVVAAIAPWNVPTFIAAAKLAPALLAGCTVVYKPAPETPIDAYRLAEIFTEAGLPKGVLSVVPAGREVGEHLVKHPGTDKVSFTGSSLAGARIAGLCGERLKRCTLELGGKSASILLDDVDLSQALPNLLPNAIMNNGQACIAQTRILAPRSRYQEVVDALVEQVKTMAVGDPLDPATQVGPLVADRQRRARGGLHRQWSRGGCHRGPGRRPPGQPGPRLLRRADRLRRRRQQDEDRPGGDLRSGPRRHPLRHPGRRGHDRQRLQLRACAVPCTRPTTIAVSRSPAASARAPTCSTRACPSTSRRPLAGSSSRASAGSSGRRA